MNENTNVHTDAVKLDGQQTAQPGVAAAEPAKPATPAAETPAPEAPAPVAEPVTVPKVEEPGFFTRAKENWDVAAAGAAIGVAAGIGIGALCFGGKSEAAVVI